MAFPTGSGFGCYETIMKLDWYLSLRLLGTSSFLFELFFPSSQMISREEMKTHTRLNGLTSSTITIEEILSPNENPRRLT